MSGAREKTTGGRWGGGALFLTLLLGQFGCFESKTSDVQVEAGGTSFSPVPITVSDLDIGAKVLSAPKAGLEIRCQLELGNPGESPISTAALFLAPGSQIYSVTDASGGDVSFAPFFGKVEIQMSPALQPGEARPFTLEYSLFPQGTYGILASRGEVLALPGTSWYPAEIPPVSLPGTQRLQRPGPSFRLQVTGDENYRFISCKMEEPISVPGNASDAGNDPGGLFLAAGPYLPGKKMMIEGTEVDLILRRESLAEDRQSWILRAVGIGTQTLRALVRDPFPEPVTAVSSLVTRLSRARMTLFFGPWLFDDKRVAADEISRELAGRFFGERMALSGSGSHWIVGIAEYAAARSFASITRDPGAFTERMKAMRIVYGKVAGKALDIPLSETHETHVEIYRHKGAAVVYTLGLLLGEKDLEGALAESFRRAREGPLSLKELQDAWASGAGRNLDAFFSQWIYSSGIPHVRLEEGEEPGAMVVRNDGPGAALFEVWEVDGESRNSRSHVLQAGESQVFGGGEQESFLRYEIDPDRIALVHWEAPSVQ